MNLGIAGYSDAIEIGRGGFGVVYRVTQLSLNRPVAIKVLYTAGLDADVQRRVDRERRALAEMASHANIVTVLDTGNLPSGAPWIAMEYCSGGTLEDRIRSNGPLPWAEAVAIVVTIADAVDHAHEHGIIHRDIKPANVLFTAQGSPRLADFGIAAVESTASATAAITGSIAYTAPEILLGEQPSRESDNYSLAATLHTVLDGKSPHHSSTSNANLAATILSVINTPPAELRIKVPDHIRDVLRANLSKTRDNRHSTSREFARALAAPVEPLSAGDAGADTQSASQVTDELLTAIPPIRHDRPTEASPAEATPSPSTIALGENERRGRSESSAPPQANPDSDAAGTRPDTTLPVDTNTPVADSGTPATDSGNGKRRTLMLAATLTLVLALIGAGIVYAERDTGTTVGNSAPTTVTGSDDGDVTTTSSTDATSASTYEARTLRGHSDTIWSVTELQDGRVASGSLDNTIRIWDLDTERTVQTLTGHRANVRSVVQLRNGHLASGSDDDDVRIWDLSTGETVQTLTGHTEGVWMVLELEDGRLASAGRDRAIRIWDLDSGTTDQILDGHLDEVSAIAELADGRLAAASGRDVHIWDLDTNTIVRTLSAPLEVRALLELADGRLAAAPRNSTILIFDLASDVASQLLVGQADVETLVQLADGSLVSGELLSGDLRVWNLDTGTTVQRLTGSNGRVRTVIELSDGRLVSGGGDTVRVWTKLDG